MEDRDATKFYEKIRRNVQHLPSSSTPNNCNVSVSSTRSDPNSKVEKIYGNVSKSEMESILKSYEKQQNSQDLSNKPVICDETFVKGGSYAKMLHAKTGFHHLGSTTHLIKELGINDLSRASFLGDYNTFSVADSEDINGLKRKYLVATTRRIIDSAHAHMSQNNMMKAKELIDQAHKLDSKSAVVKVALGKYHNLNREYEDEAKILREALGCKDIDRKQINLNLSNALFQLGMNRYHRGHWSQSIDFFRQSLDADPENSGSRLHLELASDKLRNQHHRQHSFRPNAPRYRK